MSATTAGAIPAHQRNGLLAVNVPGRVVHQPIEFEFGEPGVRHGQ